MRTFSSGSVGIIVLVIGVACGTARAQLVPGSGTGLSVDANTVGLFHFEDAATTALDSTAQNRNATVTNTSSGAGLFGGGRVFNGTSDRIEFGNVFNALTGTTAWTIEYFAQAASPGTQLPSFEANNAGAAWYFSPTDGGISYGVGTTASIPGWNVFTSVSGPSMDTAWHYYALTWTSGALKVYRDGSLLASSFTFGSWSGANTAGAYLGYDSFGGSYYGVGTVDDIRFSNIARSAVEIQETYNLAAIPEPATTTVLAGCCALGLARWRRRFKAA
jgi:hypothetical protein